MQRTWSDAYGYVLVATGRAEVMLDPQMSVWDCAALLPVMREAGGTFTSLFGEDGPWGGNALATNGHLHDAALSFLGSMTDDDGDPDWQPPGPGSVSELRPRGPRPTSESEPDPETDPES